MPASLKMQTTSSAPRALRDVCRGLNTASPPPAAGRWSVTWTKWRRSVGKPAASRSPKSERPAFEVPRRTPLKVPVDLKLLGCSRRLRHSHKTYHSHVIRLLVMAKASDGELRPERRRLLAE